MIKFTELLEQGNPDLRTGKSYTRIPPENTFTPVGKQNLHSVVDIIHFPRWAEILERAEMDLATRDSHLILIRWYLSWCGRWRNGKSAISEIIAERWANTRPSSWSLPEPGTNALPHPETHLVSRKFAADWCCEVPSGVERPLL